MRSRILVVGYLVSASLVAAPALGVAQAAPAPAPPPGAHAAQGTTWDPHPVGKYHLDLTLPDRVMGVELTVADSSGQLTAFAWPDGDNDGHPMTVAVSDTALVLHADTPGGLIQLVLRRQDDRISGTWAHGEEHGDLTGKVEH